MNGLAFTVNFLTTPGEWWSLFAIVPWLFVLILHAGLNAAIPVRAADARRTARLRVDAATPPAAIGATASDESVAAETAPDPAATSARPRNQAR